MCGIAGTLWRDPARPADRALLERMSATIRHRGPDSEGFHLDGPLGLAVRRLAIIDVAGGDQPIAGEDPRVVVTFNGEIYNFRELREELGAAGHRFRTRGDTEAIVHAYEAWGDDALRRLHGMFALALWDGPRRRLLLARDRMGEKPLYWREAPDGLLWGSEAKALLAVPGTPRRVNPEALHHYLTLQYVPDPLTIWDGIHRLPAAHKLVVERDGMPRVSRWWQLEFEPKWTLPEREAVEEARVRLDRAVGRQLVSEVPLGAFLSGGLDSSTVVALMAGRLGKPVQTFTIGFAERRYSEADYARRVAERYGTDHHEFTFRPADAVRVLEGVVGATDEPLADPAALPLYELARQARAHVTVALSGDGGDETLAGYRRYALDRWLAPYGRLPGWLTQRLVPAAVAALPEPGWLPEDRSPLTGLKRLGQFAAVTPKASLVRWGSYFTHAQKLALYTDGWRAGLAGLDTADRIAGAYDEAHATGRLDRTLHADHATYLAGDLLPKTDRVTMAHSLEARAPFLDVEWVEWTARLPDRLKVRGLAGKRLLTAAFGDRLPPAVAGRGKQGFGVPVGPWLRGELGGWARDRVLGSPALGEWFRADALRRLFAEHEAGRVNHGKRLWALLTLAGWAERYLPDVVAT